MLLFLLGKYLEEELLGHWIDMCLNLLKKQPDLFPKKSGGYYFTFPLTFALHPCQQF